MKRIFISTLFWTFLQFFSSVKALPEAEVLEKLNTVDVYSIINNKGNLLISKGTNNSDNTNIFISQTDAEKFLSKLKSQNYQLAAKLNVISISLKKVYRLPQLFKSQGKELNFIYIPKDNAVEAAEIIDKVNNRKNYNNLDLEFEQGQVPLFLVRYIDSNEYLTINQGSSDIVPIFFDPIKAIEKIILFEKQNPKSIGILRIQPTTLEKTIELLEKKESLVIKSIKLFPHQDYKKIENYNPDNYTGEGLSKTEKLLVSSQVLSQYYEQAIQASKVGARTKKIIAKLQENCYPDVKKELEKLSSCSLLSTAFYENEKLLKIIQIGLEEAKIRQQAVKAIYENHVE